MKTGGTIEDWGQVQKRLKTYFVDLDGILLKNRGKYDSRNWDTSCELIEENVQILRKLSDAGAQIIINDFAPTNPYSSCSVINIPRNGKWKLVSYIEKKLLDN